MDENEKYYFDLEDNMDENDSLYKVIVFWDIVKIKSITFVLL